VDPVPQHAPRPVGGALRAARGARATAGLRPPEARSRFIIVRGGGHWDWAGNQVIGFDPFAMAWVHLKDASMAYPPSGSPSSAFTPVYPDGSPASLHTYGCVAYMQGPDTFYSGGGI
jgi:hypothetical protein